MYQNDRKEDQRQAAERDRDRILYTSALRRLAGITQVVAASEGGVFHTRLTHTLEVAQIGRRLGQHFAKDPRAEDVGGIDPEVVEAACLAHDLGHPPFGHVAERTLDELLKGDGFEGNAQSFRIVTKLAVRHEAFDGLNLTRATLNAILKYPWPRATHGKEATKFGAYHSEGRQFEFARALSPDDKERSAEAELMDWADDVAYAVHDVEDFFRAGIVPLDRLLRREQRDLELFFDDAFARWKDEGINKQHKRTEVETAFEKLLKAIDLIAKPLTRPYEGRREQRGSLRTVTATLVRRCVLGVQKSRPALRLKEDLRAKGPKVIRDARLDREVTILKELIWHYVIRNPALASQQRGQAEVIRKLFEAYLDAASSSDRRLLPVGFRQLLETMEEDVTKPERHFAQARVAADIICSMTEQQAVAMYKRLVGTAAGSVLDAILR